MNVYFDNLFADFGHVSLNKKRNPCAEIFIVWTKKVPIRYWCFPMGWEAV